MAQQKIGPYIAEYLADREVCDANWLGKPTIPRNGRIRRSTMCRIFLAGELIIERRNVEINQMIYTISKNQLGVRMADVYVGDIGNSREV